MSSRQENEIQNGQMKNFSAANTSRIIPYNPLYRQIGKTVTGAILFQQLEYWFAKMGKPFYKFTEPSAKNSYYKEGQSWTEELGFSSDEFRTAFDNIGIRYGSKAEYDTAVIMAKESGRLDVFAGKFYCSYHDKIKGITVYYRNHSKTDARLSLFTEINNTDLRNLANSSYGEQPPLATEQGKPKSEYKQETTTENTQKNKTVEKTNTEILSLPDSDKIAIPSQSEFDTFKAEYERLYLESQGMELDGHLHHLDLIARKLKNDTGKLQILLSNFPNSWWGDKKMRPTPDYVFKFLDKNADSLSMNYKGETTAAQRDKFGGDDTAVQKIADEAIRRAEDGAREYLANGGLIF